MIEELRARYFEAVFHTDREEALGLIEEALARGVTAETLLEQVTLPAVENCVSALLREFDATIAQHFLATRIAEEVIDRLLPLLAARPAVQATVVLGTARGDFHALGKKIVAGCLRARLFEVVDLGTNVSAERFVDTARDSSAAIIGVSSMLVHCAVGDEGPRAVRRLLKERGLEDRVRLIVGGAPYRFDAELHRAVEADGWAKDGFAATELVASLLSSRRGA